MLRPKCAACSGLNVLHAWPLRIDALTEDALASVVNALPTLPCAVSLRAVSKSWCRRVGAMDHRHRFRLRHEYESRWIHTRGILRALRPGPGIFSPWLVRGPASLSLELSITRPDGTLVVTLSLPFGEVEDQLWHAPELAACRHENISDCAVCVKLRRGDTGEECTLCDTSLSPEAAEEMGQSADWEARDSFDKWDVGEYSGPLRPYHAIGRFHSDPPLTSSDLAEIRACVAAMPGDKELTDVPYLFDGEVRLYCGPAGFYATATPENFNAGAGVYHLRAHLPIDHEEYDDGELWAARRELWTDQDDVALAEELVAYDVAADYDLELPSRFDRFEVSVTLAIGRGNDLDDGVEPRVSFEVCDKSDALFDDPERLAELQRTFSATTTESPVVYVDGWTNGNFALEDSRIQPREYPVLLRFVQWCVPMTEEELAERMDHHGRVIQAVIDAIIAVEDAEAREEGMLYAAEAAAVAAAEHDLF